MSLTRAIKQNEKVYIRDEHYGWLPGQVINVEIDRGTLVRVNTPNAIDTVIVVVDDADDATNIASCDDGDDDDDNDHNNNNSNSENRAEELLLQQQQQQQQRNEKKQEGEEEDRWILLTDYDNEHILPFQDVNNVDENHTAGARRQHQQQQLLLQQQQQRNDLTALNHSQCHEAGILYLLKQRYIAKMPYTRANGGLIIAFNPFEWIPNLYSLDMQKSYTRDIVWKEESTTPFPDEDCRPLDYEPHVYEASAKAYRGIQRHQQDQSIVVCGESGSGKTEAMKVILEHLTTIHGTPNSKTNNIETVVEKAQSNKVAQYLLESSPIFEAFGNAKVFHNDNSTRFAKITKLHYSRTSGGGCGAQECPCLCASSFDTYLLETSRVVSQHGNGERNFHIFYQLLSASRETKEELLGTDAWADARVNDFRYLCNSDVRHVVRKSSDAYDWERTQHALKSCSWKRTSKQSLFRALGTVLRIGNLTFYETSDGKATSYDVEALDLLAEAMGTAVDEIVQALSRRSFRTSKDGHVDIPQTADQAREACDALAQAIYDGIFEAIVREINSHTTMPTGMRTYNTISLLDVFGFERFTTNRLEQLVVNYANEKLQQNYLRDNMYRCKLEYEKEGIDLPKTSDIDSGLALELLERHGGLFSVLDEECENPDGNSGSFLSRVASMNEQILHPSNPPCRTEFVITHFAGPVTYDASTFVTKNTNKLHDGLIRLGASSTNSLIQQAFSELLIAHERNNAQYSTMTSIARFGAQLHDLMSAMEGRPTIYVRCIKPNDTMDPNRIDHMQVLRQLRHAGVVKAMEISRGTYPNKLSFQTIADHFECLLPEVHRDNLREMQLFDKAQYMMVMLFAPLIEKHTDRKFSMPYSCGKTKVYFRSGALEVLEVQRQGFLTTNSIRLQAWMRKISAKRRYQQQRQLIVRMQARQRGRLVRSTTLQVPSSTKGQSNQLLRSPETETGTEMTLNKVKGSEIATESLVHDGKTDENKSFRKVNHDDYDDELAKSKHEADLLREELNELTRKAACCTSELAKYKEEAEHLSMELMQVSKEAERHTEKIQADYREKLAKREFEIVELRRTFESTQLDASVRRKEEEQTGRELAKYKQEAEQLRRELMQVTKEAEVHNEEITAGYHADLAKRESEMAELKRSLESTQLDASVLRNEEKQASLELAKYKQEAEHLRAELMQLTKEAKLHNEEIKAAYQEELANREIEIVELKRSLESTHVDASVTNEDDDPNKMTGKEGTNGHQNELVNYRLEAEQLRKELIQLAKEAECENDGIKIAHQKELANRDSQIAELRSSLESIQIDASVNEEEEKEGLNDADGRGGTDCHAYELAKYKREAEQLRRELMQVTNEAECHNEEIKVAYQEKLANRESEIVELKRNLESIQEAECLNEASKASYQEKLASREREIDELKRTLESTQIDSNDREKEEECKEEEYPYIRRGMGGANCCAGELDRYRQEAEQLRGELIKLTKEAECHDEEIKTAHQKELENRDREIAELKHSLESTQRNARVKQDQEKAGRNTACSITEGSGGSGWTKGPAAVGEEEEGGIRNEESPAIITESRGAVCDGGERIELDTYKRENEVLRKELMNLSSEAEFRNEEVRAEYEERLAEYETEVLGLKQTLRRYQEQHRWLEDEHRTLEESVAQRQDTYAKNVNVLREAICATHDAHRGHLNRVMLMLERADSAHRKETDRLRGELDTVRKEKDSRIRTLHNDIQELHREISEPVDRSSLGKQADTEASRLSQKLEKILASRYIIAVVQEAASQAKALSASSSSTTNSEKSMIEYVDKKILLKSRNILRRIEKLWSSSAPVGASATTTTPKTATNKENECHGKVAIGGGDGDSGGGGRADSSVDVDTLQQLLVRAYEEIERLEGELGTHSSRWRNLTTKFPL